LVLAMPAKIAEKIAIFAWKAQKVLTKLRSYSNNIDIANLQGGHNGNSLLHEVQEKEGDTEPSQGYAQEPQTSNPGCLSCLWHKSIQNREGLNFCGGHPVLRVVTQ
jgi:hypothetical protein